MSLTMTTADDNRSLTMSEIMSPDKANFAGHVHGGHLLSLLDRVAYACAARYARCYVVTLSVDQVRFEQPIEVGELITCYATVNYVGRTSMEVGIRVEATHLRTGQQRHTNSCYFTLVAVDDNGKPSPAPPFTPTTKEDKRRFEQAKERRALRLQLKNTQKSP